METLKNMGKTIGSYAEDLLNEMAVDPKATYEPPVVEIGQYGELPGAEAVQESMEDVLANIEVPQNFINQLAGKGPIKEVKKTRAKPKKAKLNLEAKAAKLVDELDYVLKKAKSIISEMTTCGMLGTNMAGKQADPMKGEHKKKGYKKIQGEGMIDKLAQAKGYTCAGPQDKAHPNDPSTKWYRAAMRLVGKTKK